MPGGGGYGDPLRARPRRRIQRDVEKGFVTSEAAARDYHLTENG